MFSTRTIIFAQMEKKYYNIFSIYILDVYEYNNAK